MQVVTKGMLISLVCPHRRALILSRKQGLCLPFLLTRIRTSRSLWVDLDTPGAVSESSKMHRCLQVREVVERIVASMEDPSLEVDECGMCCSKWYYPGASVLVALSTTCRLFSDVALNSMWHRQHGLKYLTMCLPRSKWRFDPQEGMVRALCL